MTDDIPRGLEGLAVRVCHASRGLRDEHEAWVAIDRLQQGLAPMPPHTVEAAVAFAGAKGWLTVRGRPADCVLLQSGAP